ncbi:TolC family outer membrane protein [Piscinibacter sp.]|uniref:TolC family outer membrane protein n=1 Tax=Piscinibacter sp. TaxID=1903157 RepID=UPI002CBE219F|nr:TolC family outer membrane protein [Albitalea sp.]HUG25134.1 TolC family outer membrane protein [Albitalea sp.]
MRSKTSAIATAIAMLLCAAQASAQNADPLRTAVERAVLTNPDVSARFHAYRASLDAVDIARAAYRPRLDLSASVGRDQDNISSRSPQSQSLSRHGVGLSLTQLLWDGLGTQREVERFGHDKLARYFELIEVTEQTALEAAQAYYDVQRFRRLVELAEDNYVQHKYAALQIQSRFKAGVGRGVDLEQANARQALAESNLSTEIANLHDVTARYQRIIGEAPPAQLPALAPLARGTPASTEDAMTAAIRRSAAVSASIEGLRAARASASVHRAAYQPRVEARVRTGGGKNFDGIQDQKRDNAAEIVLNWNLYNGGADQARVRQQVNVVSQAADLRDKACRDARQQSAIAYNDTRKLAEQLELLDRNTISIEKARDAYRQQFDIGQRSLLDLLNAENEVYTAKRAYANAEYDLGIAYARTHAAMNQLTEQLGIAHPAAAADATGWTAGDDAPGRCPVVSSVVTSTDRAALDERARRISDK